MTSIKATVFEILRIFYGELFNKKIKLSVRIKRIIARFSISSLFIKYYQFFSKKRDFKFSNDENFKKIDINQATVELKKYGICDNFQLDNSDLNKILEFCNSSSFYFNRDKNRTIRFNERLDHKDLYIMNIMDPHKKCEIIENIARNKTIVEIVKNYLGVYPKLDSTQIFWSVPYFDENAKPKDPPNKEFGYHYDIDGFKFLKFFIYLTDVEDENSGNHAFVTKNNGKGKNFFERIYRRLPDEKIHDLYKNRIKNIYGKKGKAFLEDTSFYHKGNFPKKERGLLAIIYNLSNW